MHGDDGPSNLELVSASAPLKGDVDLPHRLAPRLAIALHGLRGITWLFDAGGEAAPVRQEAEQSTEAVADARRLLAPHVRLFLLERYAAQRSATLVVHADSEFASPWRGELFPLAIGVGNVDPPRLHPRPSRRLLVAQLCDERRMRVNVPAMPDTAPTGAAGSASRRGSGRDSRLVVIDYQNRFEIPCFSVRHFQL